MVTQMVKISFWKERPIINFGWIFSNAHNQNVASCSYVYVLWVGSHLIWTLKFWTNFTSQRYPIFPSVHYPSVTCKGFEKFALWQICFFVWYLDMIDVFVMGITVLWIIIAVCIIIMLWITICNHVSLHQTTSSC